MGHSSGCKYGARTRARVGMGFCMSLVGALVAVRGGLRRVRREGGGRLVIEMPWLAR